MTMNTEDFLKEILAPVHEFCRTLDSNPPAYSYIPLRWIKNAFVSCRAGYSMNCAPPIYSGAG